MTNMNHHHQQPDWARLLDMLESERASQGANWSEEQRRQLDELRTLLGETEDALSLYAKLNVDEGWKNLRAMARERQLLTSPGTDNPSRSRALPRWSRIAVAASIL